MIQQKDGEQVHQSFSHDRIIEGIARAIYFYRLSVVPPAPQDLVQSSLDGQAGRYYAAFNVSHSSV